MRVGIKEEVRALGSIGSGDEGLDENIAKNKGPKLMSVIVKLTTRVRGNGGTKRTVESFRPRVEVLRILAI